MLYPGLNSAVNVDGLDCIGSEAVNLKRNSGPEVRKELTHFDIKAISCLRGSVDSKRKILGYPLIIRYENSETLQGLEITTAFAELFQSLFYYCYAVCRVSSGTTTKNLNGMLQSKQH
uniref:Uncharacterized protein n=1 Tax=Glossina austeni TaxID=7395 RepID=A0A1A9V0Z2_GLOAU